MYDKIKNPRNAGRKIIGTEARTERLSIRIEPWIARRVEGICRMAGITKAEAVRQALLHYICETEKALGGNEYGEQQPRNF